MNKPSLHRVALLAAAVAFVVIVLGAYVRLSHAGLGCPDWPGCYGELTWPAGPDEILEANQAFPDRPVETGKAWREMVHRYLAGALVLLVVGLNVLAWQGKHRFAKARGLAAGLLLLILFQAALGMWTVTLKLKPIVVMAHLMGGLATFSLLLWLAWRSRPQPTGGDSLAYVPYRSAVLVGLLVLVFQLALGGWTSANYSALVCPDFPTCQSEWWPETDFGEAFVLWREIGVDYEGGVLDLPARTAIHMAHRIGAVITLLVLGLLTLRLLVRPDTRPGGAALGALLGAQIGLGILNVVLFLPLPNAVAHNGTGALLLGAMVWLLHRTWPRYG
ncbi:MAG: COX15/CtaA family protein [Xanthomonadales bacterium]|nr:COX15/CtaA family protein [Gammaproteobacteria bacterium]MBT8052093.1 COX15/CtaA family protein [Gammaproteobacteria bacterium]MBT8056328.1 COX15/CtaA family protein [Gammaproteobacteria bacterium]NNJ80143.1 COX15/CtaA family protein [Xanthomonadales bacterium]NNL04491.1 COX15/CtaA family protein [Xanthomonadales bacterium]